MKQQETKLFTCICGYVGIRTNDNPICKCGKKGKLEEIIKDGKKVI